MMKNINIRWIPANASCLPSSVLVVTFFVPLVKGEDEFVSGFRALIRFCSVTMPTTYCTRDARPLGLCDWSWPEDAKSLPQSALCAMIAPVLHLNSCVFSFFVGMLCAAWGRNVRSLSTITITLSSDC